MEVKKNTKFQLNISKICLLGQKKHRDMGCEYHYSHIIIAFSGKIPELDPKHGFQYLISFGRLSGSAAARNTQPTAATDTGRCGELEEV